MEELECIVDRYAKLLENAKNPQGVLGNMLGEIYELEQENRNYSFLGRLTKLYGKWRVFEAILRISTTEIKPTEPGFWGYISTVCSNFAAEDRKTQEQATKGRMNKEQTVELLTELAQEIPKFKLKDNGWLTSNRD